MEKRFIVETRSTFSAHITPEKFEMQKLSVVFNLWLEKTRAGKSHDQNIFRPK